MGARSSHTWHPSSFSLLLLAGTQTGGSKTGQEACVCPCLHHIPSRTGAFFLLSARRLADDKAHQSESLGQWEFFPSDVDLLANGNLSKLQLGSAQAFGSEREVRTSSNAPLISPANESNSRYEGFMMTAMRSETKNTEVYSYLADRQLPVTGLSVYSR